MKDAQQVLFSPPSSAHVRGLATARKPAGGGGGLNAPYQHHSPTSSDAALAIEPHLNRLQARVLILFRLVSADGFTDEELCTATGLNPSTARPRRIELANKGLIVEAGQRRTRSGRLAQVWVCK